MSKPEIQVWDTVGLAVIVSFQTGVLVSSQVGGTACLHPRLEGFYLPLANDYLTDNRQFFSPETELTDYFLSSKYNGTGATNGLDIDDATEIELILERYQLSDFIKVNTQKLSQSCEAWIWVELYEDKALGRLAGFQSYPLDGVLTWSNSD